ncbi:MAG: C1 family peptidase [Deltaproteobacteria bacterium]|nr:C1 family peptidase [Deltaproteobacteria bacterium]
MSIRYMRGSLGLLLGMFVVSCGPGANTRRTFGQPTAQGPRTTGQSLGMQTVGGMTGTGYDIDGDGRADEIDLNGDGISDGEDLDGDGVITVWSTLRTGAIPPANPERLMGSTDPDAFRSLDPANTLENQDAEGEVVEPMVVVPPMANPMMMGMTQRNVLRPLNQGGQGSCTAFALGATAALQRYKRESASNAMLDVNTLWASPSWIYTRLIGDGMCNAGTSIPSGLDILVLQGAATLDEQPYRSGDNPTLCEPRMPDPARSPHVFRLGSYQAIVGTGTVFRNKVRESLAAGLPVVFGVALPTGFLEWRAGVAGVDVTQSFRNSGMCVGSTHCGGHAMVIVGYDDARSAYRVLNSWGTDWGDNGSLWWDYAAFEALPGTDAYQLIPLPTAPAPLGPPNAAGVTITLPAGSVPVLTQQLVPGSTTVSWRLVIRVRFSEPVTLTQTSLDLGMGASISQMGTAIEYGDLSLDVPGEGMPAAGTMGTVAIEGRTSDGMTFMRTLMVTVPAPRTL